MTSQHKAKTLHGIRVLVGRARHQASALSAELRKQGATVIEIPFIEIRAPRSFRALDESLRNISDYDWLILTSVNGVDALEKRMRALRMHTDKFQQLKLAAIGPATKRALEQIGLTVDVLPKEYIAESVVRSLRRRVNGKRVLLIRAKVARDVIPRELRKAGAQVDVVDAYETVVPRASRTRIKALFNDEHKKPHAITFTSSSTVRNFTALAGAADLRGIQMASIGPITSATLREEGLAVSFQATQFTIPALVEAISKHVGGRKR